ncbi:MAG TPA: ABC transporter permease [Candidatus Udaeobacter sp.]|nr:ABC transporter permease [Candidatus Udaeobacter sp.]
MIAAYLRSIARRFLWRAQTEREVEEELQSHVQLRTDALERGGLQRAEAERRARIEFGSHVRFKEECREAMAGNAVDQAIQDIRFSFRALRKAPGFSLVAVITLALGIGATVATFSVVNTVLLRPFAFSHPEKLLWIYSQRGDNPRTNFSLPEHCDYRDQATSFDGLAGVASFNPSFADSGPPERVQGVRMSASACALLGVRPLLGRTLIAEDDRNGARGVVLISYGLWSRRYARDPAVIGRPVNLNGETREIVGVLPASFALPNLDTEIVVPLQPDSDPRRNVRNSVNFLRMVGRLKPNVTAQQAHAELEAIRQNLQRQYPGIYTGKIGLTLVPLTEEIVMNIKSVLLTIFCAAGAVLLVGCVNLAGISLSRAAARQRELAVRTALGATRGQLTRLLLTESFILAMAGGSLGMLLEVWGQRALLHLVPTDLPRIESFSIDWTVLLFAGVLIFIAALACGLAPAWLLSRSDLRDGLMSSGRGTTGGGLQSRLRTWLVSGQIALALVLLANAGLLLRSFMRLSSEKPGFDCTDVQTIRFSLPQTGYDDVATIVHFFDQVHSRVSAINGIKTDALVSILPLAPKSISFVHFTRPDRPPARPEDTPTTNYRIVTSEYFRTMGIPLLHGRSFTESDDAEHPPVALVSTIVAKNHFPDRSPIGQRILVDDTDGDPRQVEIIGVVGPVKQTNLETPAKADIYLPLRQMPKDGVPWLRNSAYWVLKTSGGAMGLEQLLRDTIQNVDPNVAVGTVRPMSEAVAAALAARRFSLLLVGSFAAAALFLAAAGLYAVISYGIQQRNREIGVRLALGATRATILGMIFKEGAVLVASGIIAGVAIALSLARLVASQMYGVNEHDPFSFAVVGLILSFMSLVACGIAARRAMNIDPIVSLRCE